MVLNTNVAWDIVPKASICKCFRQCRIHENMTQQQQANKPVGSLAAKASQFKALLEVSWAEYVAFEGELQAKQLSQTPYGKAYEAPETTDKEATEPVTIAWAFDTPKAIQTLCVGESRLFYLTNELYIYRVKSGKSN